MIRTFLGVILICLMMIGCNNKDAGKNPGQGVENTEQGVSDKSGNDGGTAQALLEEIPKLDKKDFRKTGWGMDMATVKLTEADDPVSEQASAIMYNRRIGGMKAVLGYLFVDDKLIKGKYMFNNPHTDPMKYIDDYDALKKAVEKKYGKAKKDTKIWANDLYKKFPKDWGKAVELGYLAHLSSWQTKNTEITLLLKGGDKIDLWLEYKSRKFGDLEKKLK